MVRTNLSLNLFRFGAPARSHRHRDPEWGYLFCGSLDYHVGRRVFTLLPHTLFQIAPNALHHEVPRRGPAPQAFFLRPVSGVLPTSSRYRRFPIPLFAGPQNPLVLFPLGARNNVKDLLWEIWREHCAGAADARVWKALWELLGARLSALSTSPPVPEKLPAPLALLKRADDLCDNRYGDPAFHVAALSRELGVSTRWLEKNLARASGETPAGLIRRHRLGAARDLLRRGEFTVSAVARLAGFGHSAHLIRCFRGAFGETPGKWKEREANLAPTGNRAERL